MTAAELEALEVEPGTEIDSVRAWRLAELLRAGYDQEDAMEVAFHLEIDLHCAVDLVRRGCPSGTALRILA
jgi:hypothetical protein